MRKLKIKLFGKPKKGFCFFSSGNITEDLKKIDKLKTKSELSSKKTKENNYGNL